MKLDKKLFEDWMLILGRNAQYAIQNIFRYPSPHQFDATFKEWNMTSHMLFYMKSWAKDEETQKLLSEYLERWYRLLRGLRTISMQMTIVHKPEIKSDWTEYQHISHNMNDVI